MVSETVHLEGHIVDSLTLSKVLDLVLQLGGKYEISDFRVGTTQSDTSRAEILVQAASIEELETILHQIGQHGAARQTGDAELVQAAVDGVFPERFYSTTNLQSFVRVHNRWLSVEPIEMDCGIVVAVDTDTPAARCVPVHRIKAGDLVVVGDRGLRVEPLARREPSSAFGFMGSDVSTERPKELVVAALAQAFRDARAAGRNILFVGGPAIIHT